MQAQQKGTTALVVFIMLSSAALIEGSRPPRIPKPRAHAPLAAIQMQVAAGAGRPGETPAAQAPRIHGTLV